MRETWEMIGKLFMKGKMAFVQLGLRMIHIRKSGDYSQPLMTNPAPANMALRAEVKHRVVPFCTLHHPRVP